jgi:hypothetical protein
VPAAVCTVVLPVPILTHRPGPGSTGAATAVYRSVGMTLCRYRAVDMIAAADCGGIWWPCRQLSVHNDTNCVIW